MNSLDHPVNLSTLYTPLERCIRVCVGRIDVNILNTLKMRGYDQAPVLGISYGRIGIIEIHELERLRDNNQQLTEDSSAIDYTTITSEPHLGDLLDILASKRAAIAITGEQANGLITISDLNKHSLRLILYPILAEIEINLAKFIANACPDPEEWIKKLSRNNQVQILGSWDLAKRFSVDTGPLTSCTLTELITIMEKTESVRRGLGYPNAEKVHKKFGRLPDFRNTVMHPVRYLVLKHDDVGKIKESITVALELSERLINKLMV